MNRLKTLQVFLVVNQGPKTVKKTVLCSVDLQSSSSFGDKQKYSHLEIGITSL